jgi:predicted PurR-regulated permease PerM
VSDAPVGGGDRRHHERRVDARVADLTLPELRRVVVTAAIGVTVAALFLWMVRAVLVAGLLGAVAAFYLRPLHVAIVRRVRAPSVAGILALLAVFGPAAAALAYAYAEARDVAAYVGAHESEVAARVAEALERFGVTSASTAAEDARRWVLAATAYGAQLPGAARGVLARGAVAVTVFAFTAMYILTDGRRLAAWGRERLSPRYGPLAAALERNVRGVLAGALYGTLLAQLLKSLVILALAVAFGVPLAAALALLSFVLGLFPIVGSWSVYVPMAAWLYVFRDAPAAAVTVIVVGFLVNTLFISTYLRPKLAASRSRVLGFYWMFLGFVTGVYAFGLPGLVLGPALIALLKAVVDTVTAPGTWPSEADEPLGGEA